MLSLFAALSGGIAVGLGAFGAHALKAQLTAEALGWWETATLYLLMHAVAALAISLSGRGALMLSGGLLLAGAILFAATLYALALGAPRWFGAVTPLGGFVMLLGWATLAFQAWHSSPS